MKVTKLVVKNLFGIKEYEQDGRSAELSGTNGTGKSSVIEAIRLGLSNRTSKDIVIRKGESEGEILIETNSGLRINRKFREGKADYKSIKENNQDVPSPETYLSSIFSPLQLDPVEFTKMSRQEQNRAILNLIEFAWDMDYIKDKFGEIPPGVNYDQHILKVLEDIQAEDGYYFKARQDLNREIRQNEEFCARIAKSLPENYNPKRWKEYPLKDKITELSMLKDRNSQIQRAKVLSQNYEIQLSALESQKKSDIAIEEKLIEDERINLQSQIERFESEIAIRKERLKHLSDNLKDKIAVVESRYSESKAKLDKENAMAAKWCGSEIIDTTNLEEEVNLATDMIKYLTESERLEEMQSKQEGMKNQSEEFTKKIELARELPSEILKVAKIPVKGLTVIDGEPMIDKGNGPLPISNLSEGEQLDLCIDVALSKPGNLQLILIDGAERLSTSNRERIKEKCKAAGLQFIITRTTDSEDLEVEYL